MLLVYATRTKNIEKIVEKIQKKIGVESFNIAEDPGRLLDREFFLVTYTDMLGQIPSEVSNFLAANSKLLKGVAGSGNRNFGDNFCRAAREISSRYGVPLLAQFELAGTEREIEDFCALVSKSGN